MRYELDFKATFEETLLFWIGRFLHNKIVSLSTKNVANKEIIAAATKELRFGIGDIKELHCLAKKLRNAGLIGINTYANPLIKLFDYLKPFGFAQMREIDEDLLRDFIAMNCASLSVASKKNFRIVLLGFFGFIDKHNEDEDGKSYIFNIELKNIGDVRGKSGEKLPSFMNESELKRFFEGIESYPFSDKLKNRNRLVIKTIIYTGIRVSEALGLRHKDISEEGENFLLQVRGKGNKPRVVMIKKSHIADLLSAWVAQKNEAGLASEFIFVNFRDKPLSQPYVSGVVEAILRSVGIRKEKNGAHMLRHSFATLLYQKSLDLVLVQEALGHANIATSRIYTHFDKTRLAKTTAIMENL